MFTVLHVPYTYYPDPVGGTEIYVEQLAEGLRAHDIASIIVAPGKRAERYTHNHTPVYRLAVQDHVRDLSELYGLGDEPAAQAFDAILQECKPDAVHLHAFTRIVSVRFVEVAHAHNIPVLFTYHTPTVSCMRSGLMLWGKQPCDGTLFANRCTSCRLHSLGMPRAAAELVARTPPPLRHAVRTKQGGIWTALRMRDLVAQQHASFHELMEQVDAVVALCDWTRTILVNNGVEAAKIQMVPHGLAQDDQTIMQVTHNLQFPDALRLVTLGRLEPIKGIDLLLDALQDLPDLKMTLDIYGIQQSEHETDYAAALRKRLERDARIRLLPPVHHTRVISLLSQYDVLAVPSQWFETGPLVVLEAFAASIPVLGSRLGGIAEKVRDGVDGLLAGSLNRDEWRNALKRLALEPGLMERLRANVRPPRSIEEVAAERASMYRSLVQQTRERV